MIRLMARRWTIWKHGQRQYGTQHGTVRRIVEDGVLLPTPRVEAVREKPSTKEDQFRDGRVWQLVPGVTQEQVEVALRSLKIKIRVR